MQRQNPSTRDGQVAGMDGAGQGAGHGWGGYDAGRTEDAGFTGRRNFDNSYGRGQWGDDGYGAYGDDRYQGL